jgi:short-subunit dehydrogenase
MNGGDFWVIVGASSAIARAFARRVARDGAAVLLAGRDFDDLSACCADLRIRGAADCTVLSFDAADDAGHAAFVATLLDRAGDRRLNLFYAAGSMADQDTVASDFDLAKTQVAINYLAVVSLTTRLEARFRAQRGGAVVVLGSVAGDRGRRKNYLYGSAKAGLAAYLQGWRSRMLGDGVHVVTVKPGFVDTAMTWGLPGMFLVAPPEAVADAALTAVRKKRDVIYTPFFWRPIMSVIRAIPEPIFKRLSI